MKQLQNVLYVIQSDSRLTLSEDTTKEEIDFTVDKLKMIVERLRSMSPLYEDFLITNNLAIGT